MCSNLIKLMCACVCVSACMCVHVRMQQCQRIDMHPDTTHRQEGMEVEAQHTHTTHIHTRTHTHTHKYCWLGPSGCPCLPIFIITHTHTHIEQMNALRYPVNAATANPQSISIQGKNIQIPWIKTVDLLFQDEKKIWKILNIPLLSSTNNPILLNLSLFRCCQCSAPVSIICVQHADGERWPFTSLKSISLLLVLLPRLLRHPPPQPSSPPSAN